MAQQLKLNIYEKGELIESIEKETETDLPTLYKSLEEFRILANVALTKLVEKSGNSDTGNLSNDEYCDEDISSEDDEVNNYLYANQIKKKKMNA